MSHIENLTSCIGNTPLAEIKFTYKNKTQRLFAKLEYFNLTGSVKDRMAFHILSEAIKRGELKPGDRIAEATSGNTGISMCALGAYLKHPVTIFMPDWMSKERQDLIASFGAEIRLVSSEEGGFLGSIGMADQLAEDLGDVFLPHQFDNEDNMWGQYHGLGQELIDQLKTLDLQIDGFVAGVGTGGVVMGVGRALKEANPNVIVHPLEPEESPTLSTGTKVGSHRIAGISDEFIPSICKLKDLNSVMTVSDGDSIIMAQKLAHSGLGVGISSGANFVGTVKMMQSLPDGAVATTVFSDDNKKYLSSDLMKEEPIKAGFLSPDIEILDITIHR